MKQGSAVDISDFWLDCAWGNVTINIYVIFRNLIPFK